MRLVEVLLSFIMYGFLIMMIFGTTIIKRQLVLDEQPCTIGNKEMKCISNIQVVFMQLIATYLRE
jgi:hypothetical protein